MNKVMLYVGLAILLGTVTMVAPLALLRPEEHRLSDTNLITPPENLVTDPEPTEPSSQERSLEEGELLESGDFSAQVTTPEPAPAAPTDTSETTLEPEVQPQEPELVVRTAENTTDLSPIGLLTVPSFLVALGVFVFIRKRIY
jgi:cytoskeletal protein RodZ